jgi:phosphatidylinositol alpha-1,6-mannosyltransferase
MSESRVGTGGRTLVVTNDFPPRRGGIESFVLSICRDLPADQVVVYTASMPDADLVDDALDFPVVRDKRTMLLPTRRLGRAVEDTLRTYDCDEVVFGAAAPLGLLARRLRRAGAKRIVGVTHGHEVWWAAVPGARSALRRIGDSTDALTYVSEYCRERIARALSPAAAGRMRRLSPSVDATRFHPGVDGAARRHGLGIASDRPVVLAASRMVKRKGHDTLVRAWPDVLRVHPDALLLIVGDGPRRTALVRRIRRRHLEHAVRLVPSVPWESMPELYAAANVFALPCRTRRLGLEPEAFGIVFLEAAACGLPIVVGDSGGAPETLTPGTPGCVVDPRDVAGVARAITAAIDSTRSEQTAAASP